MLAFRTLCRTVGTMRNRYGSGIRHRSDQTARRDVAGAAATLDRPGCRRRRGGPVRDRARWLAAVAVGIGLIGAGATSGVASAATRTTGPTVAPLHGLLQAD